MDPEAALNNDLVKMSSVAQVANGLSDEGVIMSPPPAQLLPEHPQEAATTNERADAGDLYGDLLNLDQDQSHSVTSQSLGDSKYEFDNTFASDIVSPPPSSDLLDEAVPPSNQNNDVILVDLETKPRDETDIHELSTASVTPQSPPYNFDSFDPLQPDQSTALTSNGLTDKSVFETSAETGDFVSQMSAAPPVVESQGHVSMSSTEQLMEVESRLKEFDTLGQTEIIEDQSMVPQRVPPPETPEEVPQAAPVESQNIMQDSISGVVKSSVEQSNMSASLMESSLIIQSDHSLAIEADRIYDDKVVDEHVAKKSQVETFSASDLMTQEQNIITHDVSVEEQSSVIHHEEPKIESHSVSAEEGQSKESEIKVSAEKGQSKESESKAPPEVVHAEHSQEAPGAPRPDTGSSKPPPSPTKKHTSIPSPKKDIPGSPRRSAPGSPGKTSLGSPKKGNLASPKKTQEIDKKKPVEDSKSKAVASPRSKDSSDKGKAPSKPATPRQIGESKTSRAALKSAAPASTHKKTETERPKSAPGGSTRSPRPTSGGAAVGAESKPNGKSTEKKKYGIDSKREDYKPGGGNVKIVNEKVSVNTTSKIDAGGKASPRRPMSSPRQSDGVPKTGSTPGTSKAKAAVSQSTPGAIGSPKLKTVHSRVGSLDNAKHTPGGGNVKIQSKKIDLANVQSKCGSKDNVKHRAGGGEKKIFDEKPQWKIESKIGSLDNAKHKAGGGVKKIETNKLEWKAQSKIGSLDYANHVAGGGAKKIETRKLDFKEKAQSKVGSKDNITHKAGGGNVKIMEEKLEFREKATPKVGSKDNIKHQPGGGCVRERSETEDGSAEQSTS